jgi:hypothetical protein
MGDPVPGTDQSLAIVRVPIVGSDRVLGTMQLENYERENAYAKRRYVCSARSQRAWAWRSKMRGSSTRRSGC